MFNWGGAAGTINERLCSVALPRGATKYSLGFLAQRLVCTLNHLFVVARRRRRARISYRSRTVLKLMAWTAVMPSQAFACVLEVSLPSVAPCPG
jgi:hypothetical protein